MASVSAVSVSAAREMAFDTSMATAEESVPPMIRVVKPVLKCRKFASNLLPDERHACDDSRI